MLDGCVEWPEEFIKDYIEKGYWENTTLGEHFDKWTEDYADRTALAFGDKTITYAQMGEEVTRLSYQLVQMGIKTYDPVILQLFNSHELLYLFYACFKIGAIPICSLPTHRWSEIHLFAEMTQAKAHVIPAGVVQDFDYEEFAEQLREEVSSLEHVLTLGKPGRPNMVSLNEMIETEIDLEVARATLDEYRPDPFEPALFQLSGGTTGVPKIIPRTHADYYYNAKCCAERYDINQDTRFLAPLPMPHNAPLAFMILPTHLSGGMIVPTAPKPEFVIQEVMKQKINYMPMAQLLVPVILELPVESVREIFGTIEKLWCATIRSEDLAKMREIFNCESYQLFGMAEGFGAGTAESDSPDIKICTQGRPLSDKDEVKIINPFTLEELPLGEVGELVCRGPYTICGYYKSPERNADAFTKDGFYRTGDLVTLDSANNISWKGRIKDCIDRGGEKISAEEVEGHIAFHPKVKDVAVVGMPDKAMGERVCVFVVKDPALSLTLEELREFLTDDRRIAKYKMPERIEFLNELPQTGVGKFEKKSLRTLIAATLEAEKQAADQA